MKITLIEPKYFNIWEPIGLAYIGGYLKRKMGGGVDVNFFQGYFDSDEDIIKGASGSEIVGFSCTSPTFKHGVSLARELKKRNPKVHTVFGGCHVSALKGLVEEECIDQIVVGEGEQAFYEIVKGNRERQVQGVPLQFKELGWPDRELVKNHRTVELCEKMVGRRITSFQGNRVCPFRCRFCAEKTITGIYNKRSNPIRSRDVGDLLDEIEHVAKKYRLDSFKFVDATFDTSSEFVISFCEEKMRRKFTLEWECMVHAGIARREMFAHLKGANCKQINIGCESGSPKVLRDINKGTTLDKVEEVFLWAREARIERRAFFILGMPTETREDVRLTEKFVEKIEPDVFGVTMLCPYPGSDFYDHEKMRGVEWEKTDEYSNDFWSTDYLTNADLKSLQKQLTEKYKDRLAWHNKILRSQ